MGRRTLALTFLAATLTGAIIGLIPSRGKNTINYFFGNKKEVRASQPVSKPTSYPIRREEPYYPVQPEIPTTQRVPRDSDNRGMRIARQMSQEGLNLIRGFEGFSPNVYPDVAGNPTIGYGHLIRPGENFRTITQEQALDLLRRDVSSAENAVNSSVNVQLTQNQYDALVSFAYNIGNGAFRNSTLVRRLNEGNYQEARNQFGRWVNAGGRRVQGLINRKQAEAERFGD